MEHIAVIPARKESKGLKNKNRILIDNCLRFVKKIKWFKKVIITSDDEFIINKAIKNKLCFIKRSKKLSNGKISIKTVMLDVIKKTNLNKNTIVWLIYIPLIGKKKNEFDKAKKIIQKKKNKSLCGFAPVKSHPFNAWYLRKKKMKRLFNKDIYRRQDLPKMWEHNHLICAFKVDELNKLNSELINNNTTPFIFKKKAASNIIEIDYKEDLKKIDKNNV